jgi:hypothetical protein
MLRSVTTSLCFLSAFPNFAMSQETNLFWASGPWLIETVPDEFYGAGTGCRLSLDNLTRSASFAAFFVGGPVKLGAPELLLDNSDGTVLFTDPISGYVWSLFGKDSSADFDGWVEMRTPSANMMQALEGFARAGTVTLIVSDKSGSFEFPLDVTGLDDATLALRSCVDELGLGL